ncbi:MAG TPA: NAD(P)/FAD-dependent oxidoreductase [Phycisphaerae bacterium]|nr:NAD(P)/FAD-dependent oxidoreductase [Phycisphaerae bacterium]
MSELDVAILGAGAAGMMAAVAAGEGSVDAGAGRSRLRIGVFEKNVRPGIKVLVCGGGRCNFTNAGSVEFLIEQFGRNGRFLTPALRHLDNEGLRAFFAERGVPSHEEHDGKIYPDSNQAKSVVDALVNGMRSLGVEIFTGQAGTVVSVEREELKTTEDTESTEGRRRDQVSVPSVSSGVPFRFSTADGLSHTAKIVLLAVGGMSYQRMGTTGDGYRFAEGLGHTVVTPRPAIVGLLAQEGWVKELQGLAVEEVEVRIAVSGALPKLATGKPTPSVNDMLFTHFGLSGPAVLNVSEIVAELLEKFEVVPVVVDFAHRKTHEELHELFRSWQQHQGKKLLRKILCQHARDIEITSTSPDQTGIGNAAGEHSAQFSLPTRLAEKFLELEGIPREQVCATLSSGQMHRLVERIKNTRFAITGTRGFKEAMVTAGGVKLSEVDPRTMESKVCPNLFLTGEVLDLTGPSGGYNLQLAFSTGHLAGSVVARRFAD